MSNHLNMADVDQMLAAFERGQQAGAQLAQQLRVFLQRISDPSVDALAAARELGIEDWARQAMKSE